jgi:hypothetical protein
MRLPVATAAAPMMGIIIDIRAIFIVLEITETAMRWLSEINPPPNALICDRISFAHFTSRMQRDALPTSDIDLHQRPVPPPRRSRAI